MKLDLTERTKAEREAACEALLRGVAEREWHLARRVFYRRIARGSSIELAADYTKAIFAVPIATKPKKWWQDKTPDELREAREKLRAFKAAAGRPIAPSGLHERGLPVNDQTPGVSYANAKVQVRG